MKRASTLSFLFADLRDYTAFVEGHGDAAATALIADFRRLIRSEVARSGGGEIKTEGDSFCVVFPSTRLALQAAIGILRKAEGRARRRPDRALRIGVGIHAGEPEPHEGQYVGSAVNVAARLAQQAGPGELLVSDLVRGLLRTSSTPPMRERHGIVLKGIEEPLRIYAVAVGRRPAVSERRQQGGADGPRGNLPTQLTSFVGRVRELSELASLQPRARLLTITGPGGSGKTRIALQLAADTVQQFADGAWLVDLAPLEDPALVMDTIAAALGLRDGADRQPLDAVMAYLKDKRLLLILDNCEHLASGVAAVADSLLQSCPDLSVLVTSRQPLDVPGEVLWQAPPLAVPDAETPGLVESLLQVESVRLFMDRATDRLPQFEVDGASALSVARICRRLEGLPLAIELAAARIRVLTVDQILERLSDRFKLLTGGARTLPSRHQTLLAAISWSYELLTTDERTVFRVLSVFSGSFNLEDAEEISANGHIRKDSILDLLSGLSDKSLINAERGRYRLLDTVRDFGRRKLEEAGELDACQRRLAERVLGLVRSTSSLATADWLDVVAANRDNLRSALDWCQHADPELGLALVIGSHGYWQRQGHVAEARHHLERLLMLEAESSPLVATANLILATYAYMQGDQATTETRLSRCLELARELGDRRSLAEALGLSGTLALSREDEASAISRYNEELDIWREIGDRRQEATALFHLGMAVAQDGNVGGGRTFFEQSLAVLDELRLRPEGLMTMAMLAGALVLQGELSEARQVLRECLDLALRHRDRRLAIGLEVVAGLAVADGDPDRALMLAGAAAAMYEESGQRPAEPWLRLVATVLLPAREQLGESDSEAAWSKGRQLTFEQAASYALEGIR